MSLMACHRVVMDDPGQDGVSRFVGLTPGAYTIIGLNAPDETDGASSYTGEPVYVAQHVELTAFEETVVRLEAP
jgi:hypothetical protein